MIIIAFTFLLIAIGSIEGPGEKTFGNLQRQIISSLNTKDSILLYLDYSAEFAKRDTFQSELGETAGVYLRIDSSDPNQDITGCGNHIYPSLSTIDGKVCVSNYDYSAEYSKLFRRNLLTYLSNNPHLNSKAFFDIHLKDNKIMSMAGGSPVELIISTEEINIEMLPPSSIINLNIPAVNNVPVVNKVKKIDLTKEPFASLKSGYCSKFVNTILNYAYDKTYGQNNHGTFGFPGDAWDVAAKYLKQHRETPDASRVVYAGSGIKSKELLAIENLLIKGDILFTSTPSTWCRWSGYNGYRYELLGDEAKNYCGGGAAFRKDENENDKYTGFCTPDSILENKDLNPTYCDFSEGGINQSNYIIVTHIFMYLGTDESGEHILANLFSAPSAIGNAPFGKLKTFVDNSVYSGDGVRMIVRPVYPRK
jgi:hypothetical protein